MCLRRYVVNKNIIRVRHADLLPSQNMCNVRISGKQISLGKKQRTFLRLFFFYLRIFVFLESSETYAKKHFIKIEENKD